MRCALCGEPVEAGDLDAVEVGSGIVHEDCFAERDDEGLFGAPDPESAATGRAEAFEMERECSVAEIERQRAAEGRRRMRSASRRVG